MLELIGVTKKYGEVAAVQSCTLTVNTGEFVTLLGPSGSGKSTLLSLIAGFTPLTEGTMLLDGRDISRVSAAERGIGVVFQNYALFPHMTIFENVAYGLHRRRWTTDRIRQRVEEMLELIGLPQIAKRRPDQLSGGQQQRVALARALAFQPSLLLMDEPLGALDREIRDQMQQEIRRIHREARPSVVYVTHNREEAFALSDRVAILESGQVRAYDTAHTLYTRPANRFVASFFGAHQLFPAKAKARDGALEVSALDTTARMTAPGTPDGDVLLAIGARDIMPANGAASGLSVPVRIDDVVYMGDTTRLICRHDPSSTRIISEVDSHLAQGLSIGSDTVLDVRLERAALVAA
ncbi:ABC transporter ATP-binding protein [Paradevosia shaoguanensis]|uniref:ABC transporter ATP-binding protein n=1 Tax=Paradevosia shaoguanensis TaxID=1335043 RepID=UPI001931DD16|nr:ABC transporter ATP-binding protein [Paradevosia shaoguanensis]